MEFEVTQWEAWGGGASKEVVLEEDREDDTGEFFYVSWASVAESGGGFLAYSTGVGDRGQVNGKGKSRVFRERVRGGLPGLGRELMEGWSERLIVVGCPP